MEHLGGILPYLERHIEVLKWLLPLIGGLIAGIFTIFVPKKVGDTLFERLYITGQRDYYLRLIVGILVFSCIPIFILYLELGNDRLIKNLPIIIILNLVYLLMLVLFYDNILSVKGSFYVEDEHKNRWFFEKYNANKDIFYMKSEENNLSHSFKSKKFEDVIDFVQHQYNYEDIRFYLICKFYNELSQSTFKKYRTQGWVICFYSIFFLCLVLISFISINQLSISIAFYVPVGLLLLYVGFTYVKVAKHALKLYKLNNKDNPTDNDVFKHKKWLRRYTVNIFESREIQVKTLSEVIEELDEKLNK